MSKFPLDIVNFNNPYSAELEEAISIANSIQSEFLIAQVSDDIQRKFKLLNFEEIDASLFLKKAIKIRKSLLGFYPHMTFYTNAPIHSGGWHNLFADADLKNKISLVTTHNVPEKIIPADRMTSYFVYYFARGILKFILKDNINHDQSSKNGCLFDFMEDKADLLKSMRPNAICDDCRKNIMESNHLMSENQLHAIDILLTQAGSILKGGHKISNVKPRIFIASSTEGLDIARKIKSSLRYDANVDTWADGIFDKPGQAYMEILENVLETYDYGIFVFTPDDKIFSRGTTQNIPRDNVIFEYGMFLGRHSRKKAFFIIPRGVDIKIMTDVLGLTYLDYDPKNPNIQSAVGDACDQIRGILNEPR